MRGSTNGQRCYPARERTRCQPRDDDNPSTLNWGNGDVRLFSHPDGAEGLSRTLRTGAHRREATGLAPVPHAAPCPGLLYPASSGF